ncbi:hypothetical protein L7F22_062260 [Adiantum nelumboides]|nr:hypothetical protein [Adiantum nelumboides]
MPKERMLAHCRIDAKRKRLVAITCYAEDTVLPTSTFTVYEFYSSLKLLQRKQFTMQEQQMVHDWGLTDNYYVLIANRVKLDHIGNSIAAFAGVTPMISSLSLDDSLHYAPMYLLPRLLKEGERQRDWSIPIEIPERLWLLHVANAYEEPTQEKGKINIIMHASACTYEWFSLQHIFGYDWQHQRLSPQLMNDEKKSYTKVGDLGAPHLVKFVVTFNPQENEAHDAKVQRPKGWQKGCDFPVVNAKISGLRNEYTYVGASSRVRKCFQNFPFDTIVKVRNSDESAVSWWSGKRCFVGEPVFISRHGSIQEATHPCFVEDNGYLLCIAYNVAEQVCYMVILDAQRLGKSDTLVARLKVPKQFFFPIGFHAFWDEDIDL